MTYFQHHKDDAASQTQRTPGAKEKFICLGFMVYQPS